MNRRRLLCAGVAIGVASLSAGCFGGDGEDEPDDENESGDENESTNGDENAGFEAMPRVEDPPEAVYLPTHRDGTIMLETRTAGELAISPMLSIPHFFWLMPGPERVDPPATDAVHLMVAIWDPETEVVIPIDSGLTIELAKDGTPIITRSPWPMLSQGMGFHFGDNYEIDGNGRYTATVTVNPMSDVRLTGEFAGRFDERTSATVEFELDEETRRELVDRIERFDEGRWGSRDAVPPMGDRHGEGESSDRDESGDHERGGGHEMPYSSVPPVEALPGRLLGEPTHDDAVYATTLLSPGSRFVDGDEYYLAVSSRTPYNRCVLPQQALSARVARGDETIAETTLRETLDHELHYHYGAPIADLRAGDQVVVSVETPSQAARHQGYETAFRSPGELTFELEEV
ncbi:DUF7350 domain-containing protein [Halosolutus gelatinilyticus]|uniref:DUF7350 domain-containing protein n=1 Tax=Halosolutus gelatinilyticus TaxID=2931975 RepID=UPI001FF1DE34|nr:hypothetical protein [Halosolutus gelatinilyticus]